MSTQTSGHVWSQIPNPNPRDTLGYYYCSRCGEKVYYKDHPYPWSFIKVLHPTGMPELDMQFSCDEMIVYNTHVE